MKKKKKIMLIGKRSRALAFFFFFFAACVRADFDGEAVLDVIINVEPFAEVHLIDDEADLMDNGGSSPDSSRNPDVPPGARFMVKANAPCTLTASAAKIVQKPRGPYGVATRESDGRQFTYTYGLMSRWEVDPDICLWPDSDGAIQFTIDGEDENGRPCIGLTRVMAMRVVPDADETAHGEMRSPGRRTGDLPRSGIYTGFFNLTVALK